MKSWKLLEQCEQEETRSPTLPYALSSILKELPEGERTAFAAWTAGGLIGLLDEQQQALER